MFRHSKRCFTQVTPASLASFKSRSASSRWPHRKTCAAGETGATRLSCTRFTVGAATFGRGVGEALATAAGFGGVVPPDGFCVGVAVGAPPHAVTNILTSNRV